MRNREMYSILLIVVVAGLAVWINVAPVNNNGTPDNPADDRQVWLGRDVSIRQGLDLQGGIQVLLRSQNPNVTAEEMRTAAGVIERRVNALGVGETVVQSSGTDRIIVELPGVANPEQAIETLRGTGQLEFIDPQGQFLADGQIVRTEGNPNPPQPTPIPVPTAAPGTSPLPTPAPQPETPIFPSITQGRDLDTNRVQPAAANQGTTGSRPAVAFAFVGESAARLADFTARNVGRPMCIVLDSRIISCPVVNAALTDGSGIIETNSTADRDRIFNQLKFGALPVPLVVETSRSVTATLGRESVNASLLAGIVGLTVVGLFMILFYRLPGVLATIALLIYTAITFGLYRLIPVTLTLPGIAGFILSIGLAVDANVLIFARIREEYRRRSDMLSAINSGFEEAWPAIRDSSVSTIITSVILFMFASSFGISIVQGFALTLGLGMVISLFTAIVITRTFMRLMIPLGLTRNPWLFGLEKALPRISEPPAEFGNA